MSNYPTRDGFVCKMPKPGDGTRIMHRPDGSLYLSWDRPRTMAMDAAIGGPRGGPDDNDFTTPGAGGYDLEDKVRQLLEGKLSTEDLDALCNLLDPGSDTAPAPVAQDRGRRRQARDQIPSMPQMQRLVAQGAANRAQRVQDEIADLTKRFPALKTARVV